MINWLKRLFSRKPKPSAMRLAVHVLNCAPRSALE